MSGHGNDNVIHKNITQDSQHHSNLSSNLYHHGNSHQRQPQYTTVINHEALAQDSNGHKQDTPLKNQIHQLNSTSTQLHQINNNTWQKNETVKNNNSSIITGVVGKHRVLKSGVQKQLFYNNVTEITKEDFSEVISSNSKEDPVSPVQNDLQSNKHMNCNGYGRGRMTGSSSSTNENLSWLADVAASQSSQSQSQPSEGIIAGRLEGQEGLQQLSLHVPGSTPGTIFRQSVTMAEGGQRLMTGNQYLGGNPSMGSYSPLYSVHGQPQHVSNISQQYSPLYPYSSYPHAGSSLIATGHYPHIESYSAVLASMGSHVQHGNPGSQSQLPRNTPFMTGSPMPQYSTLSSHRNLSTASSPNPLHPSGSYNIPGEAMIHDSRSPKVEGREDDRGHRSGSSSNLREERSQAYSSGKSGPLSSPGEKDIFYKVPSGKEGSLKHRILTRPLDTPGEIGNFEDNKYSPSLRSDEPSVKRTKLVASSGASHVSRAEDAHGPGHGPGPPQELQGDTEELQVLPPPHLHYPPHFMKGSVIQLANNKLKRVEDLETSDFIESADISSDLKIDSSTVIRIDEHLDRGTAILGFSVGEHKVKVTVEATLEHPFFVFGRGWSSCSPVRTSQRYGLECHTLSINDICISLTHKDVTLKAAEISQQQARLSPATSRRGQGQGHDISTYSETVRISEGHITTPLSRPSEASQDSYQRRQFPTSESVEYNQAEGHSSTDRKQ